MISQKTIQAYVDLMRPYNSPPLWLSFGIGVVLAGTVGMLDTVRGLLILTLLHSAANMYNDLIDLDVDRANKRRSGLLDGTTPPHVVLRLAQCLTAVALVVALIPDQRWIHVMAAIIFCLLAWLYNSPHIRASRRPIASIVILGLFYSAIPLVYGYMLGVSDVPLWMVLLIGSWLLQRMSISIMKDYKDVAGDKQYAKHTFYLKFGHRATVATSIVLGVAGYASAAWLLLVNGLEPTPLWWVASGLAIASLLYRLRQVGATNEKQLTRLFGKSFSSQNLFEVMVILCLIL